MGLFKKKQAAAAALEETAEVLKTPEDDNSELIAVITAAIAAYEAEQFRQKLYIRKIDRSCGIRPIWGATGTQEAIDVRRI